MGKCINHPDRETGYICMTHLLLGINQAYIRPEAYIPTVSEFPIMKSRNLGLKASSYAGVFVMPGPIPGLYCLTKNWHLFWLLHHRQITRKILFSPSRILKRLILSKAAVYGSFSVLIEQIGMDFSSKLKQKERISC